MSDKHIADYWRKDAERKLKENKITKYDSDHYQKQSGPLLEFFNSIGATNVMTVTENVDAPKIMFDYREKTYYTDEIFDYTCSKIIENVKSKIIIKTVNVKKSKDVSKFLKPKNDSIKSPSVELYIKDFNGKDGMIIKIGDIVYDDNRLNLIKHDDKAQQMIVEKLQQKITKTINKTIFDICEECNGS